MINSLFLLAASIITGFIGLWILLEAMDKGSFSGIPDQVLMMTCLIASAVFLTGTVISEWLRCIHRELVRQRKLSSRRCPETRTAE
jgi:hypothetical protein